MDRKLTEFAALLRNQGVRVSPPELADASRIVQLLGYASRERFRQSLAMSLAKSVPDHAIFQRCFEQFFAFTDFAAPDADAREADMPRDNAGQGPLSGSGGGGGSGEGSALGEMLLGDDRTGLQLAMAQAVETVQLQNIRVITQQGLFARRLLMAMGLQELEAEISGLEGGGTRAGRDRAEALRAGRARLQQEARETVQRYFLLARENLSESTVRELGLTALQDFHDVKGVVARMARRLIAIHARRKKLQDRGQLDLRRTLRHNQPYDGLIVEPQWRRRKKDRPKVMAVCDVSRSVAPYARFLLMFLYSMQEIIPGVRAFAFSGGLGEVTDLFESQELEAALDIVMERYGFGSTDYGQALLDLENLALNDIDRNTTLIILGDARNNNGNAQLEKLRLFHARAKQVLWINPEAMNRWGSGDSEMLRYRSYCTRVVSCGSLAQLERAVDWMLRRA